MESLIGAAIGVVFWCVVGVVLHLVRNRPKRNKINVIAPNRSFITRFIVRRYNALPARYRNEDIESILTELDAQYGTSAVSKHYCKALSADFVYCSCEYLDGEQRANRARSTEFCKRYGAIRDQVEKLHKIAAEQERIMREQSITTATADDLITRLKQEVEVGRAVTEEMQGPTHEASRILPPANYADTVKVLADGLVLRRQL